MSSICKPNCVTVLPNFGTIDQCDITALLSSGEITNEIFDYFCKTKYKIYS